MKRHLIAAAVLLLLGTANASAQTVDVPTLSMEGARRVLDAAETEAKRNGWNVSIAITDPAGQLLAFARLDGAPPASIGIAQGKARTAAWFRRPSKAIEDLAASRAGVVTLEGITALEGGVPITVGERVVGAIGVSGVTSQQDAQVARAGAAAVAPASGPR